MSPHEQRIQALERRYYPLPTIEVKKLLQDIWHLDPDTRQCSITFTIAVAETPSGTPIAGASVQVWGAKGLVAAGITNAAGLLYGALGAEYASGAFTYSVSASGHTTATGSFSVGGCGSQTTVPVLLSAPSCSLTASLASITCLDGPLGCGATLSNAILVTDHATGAVLYSSSSILTDYQVTGVSLTIPTSPRLIDVTTTITNVNYTTIFTGSSAGASVTYSLPFLSATVTSTSGCHLLTLGQTSTHTVTCGVPLNAGGNWFYKRLNFTASGGYGTYTISDATSGATVITVTNPFDPAGTFFPKPLVPPGSYTYSATGGGVAASGSFTVPNSWSGGGPCDTLTI